ncbi:ring-cleaving dioxygenase [Oceanobacillus caeni]|uniref:ring-cleaving dioxygenase n=1 Tax=Oceanobacillus caeni TaxID=405946 RepID=UPI00062252C7|nr:ring-cleaving dioxygenase [Oceanobacillus caeni]KKE80263.1 ring-cleaving dioxygenase [Bacilli bacterium VT-13-104]PZD87976.1 ring-cleaving dioxygenase [Bacilli bacterium]MED4473765.1 ring-cleaving dioxygenase [Oceanobacillus caeni]PZD90167.1 ring-cleaving dioxygenase [Bacilli bacterium]PZD92061.1 ring-cleaving dioxygenase [Bacilli bacterium]
MKTAGIHHITAIVNDPQVNVDFYSRVLGLRLVKKTVNFDRPEVYHLYFGNESGNPGTIITFFPWPKLLKGRVGIGQVGTTSYVVPIGSMDFWKNRLREYKISFTSETRFNENYMKFKDPDGLKLEIVERDEGLEKSWRTKGIPSKYAIKGFAGAILNSTQPNQTKDVLETILNMKFVKQEDDYLRFKSDGVLGNVIDIKLSPSVRGLAGAGTVHHIAWRAKDDEELENWRELLEEKGYKPTEIKERNYFKAVYFYEPGGILFEIATDLPGFSIDESPGKLGEKLMLPSWLEHKRKEFEEILPPIEVEKEDL